MGLGISTGTQGGQPGTTRCRGIRASLKEETPFGCVGLMSSRAARALGKFWMSHMRLRVWEAHPCGNRKLRDHIGNSANSDAPKLHFLNPKPLTLNRFKLVDRCETPHNKKFTASPQPPKLEGTFETLKPKLTAPSALNSQDALF